MSALATHPTQIATVAPILPRVRDPEWEQEVRRVMGAVPDFALRIAPSPWLRRTCLEWKCYQFRALPPRLADIGFLVTSQENSCRYCYGTARAMMRLLGYSEGLITRIERNTQLAELDPRERAFIAFCRNLARSNPRPGRMARDELIALGYSPLAIAEMAFMIANFCFGNRIATLLGAPPEAGLEQLALSWKARLLRPLIARQLRKPPAPRSGNGAPPAELSPVARTLEGLPAAALLQQSLDAAFASEVLSPRAKALMFAVVARALECRHCETEMVGLLGHFGVSSAAAHASLASLSDPELAPEEAPLLAWARDTVRYQPLDIQERTRALADRIGPARTLEAIGVAALANATVRLAMLME